MAVGEILTPSWLMLVNGNAYFCVELLTYSRSPLRHCVTSLCPGFCRMNVYAFVTSCKPVVFFHRFLILRKFVYSMQS